MPLSKNALPTSTNSHGFLKPWLLALRPKTLSAAVVPVMVGTALVYAEAQALDWSLTLCALFGALFIQIGTNLVNDAIDFKKGADTAERIGPTRVTQSGMLTSRQVMAAAAICFLLAIVFGVPLVLRGGLPLVAIGLISIFFAYTYTAGPFPLAYLGLGDLFVILFFGIVAVSGVYYVHTLRWSEPALIAGLQVGFLAAVLIAINNLRDVEQDAKVGKKTLAVRFGKNFVRVEILLLTLGAFLLGGYWLHRHQWLAGALPLVIFPLARRLLQDVFANEPSPVFNQYLAKAGILHLVFGLQLSLGLLLIIKI